VIHFIKNVTQWCHSSDLIKDLTDVPKDTCVKLLELLNTYVHIYLALLQEAFWFAAKLLHQTKLENHSE